jgi:hypothetical protein
MSMKKSVIAIAISTVAVSGVSVGMAHASSAAKVVKASRSIVSRTVVSPTNPMGGQMMEGRAEADLTKVLADLVSKGTISAHNPSRLQMHLLRLVLQHRVQVKQLEMLHAPHMTQSLQMQLVSMLQHCNHVWQRANLLQQSLAQRKMHWLLH